MRARGYRLLPLTISDAVIGSPGSCSVRRRSPPSCENPTPMPPLDCRAAAEQTDCPTMSGSIGMPRGDTSLTPDAQLLEQWKPPRPGSWSSLSSSLAPRLQPGEVNPLMMPVVLRALPPSLQRALPRPALAVSACRAQDRQRAVESHAKVGQTPVSTLVTPNPAAGLLPYSHVTTTLKS